MAKVLVRAQLISSMLHNRRRTIEEAASEIALKHGTLQEYTSSDTQIELDDLKNIARYFKKPWTYLLLDGEERKVTDYGHDNRTAKNQKAELSNELLAALENADYMLSTISELFPDIAYERFTRSLSYDSNLEQITRSVRLFLGVTLEAQLKAKNEYAALRLWTNALQDKGIYVAQKRINDERVRAFSIARNGKAIVVVSTQDNAYARIFSLLHEYCHILLKNTGICDLDNEHSRTERFCNEFAATLLMPRDELCAILDGNISGHLEEDEQLVAQLSRHFKVSQAALLIRLLALKELSDDEYLKLEARRSMRKAARGGGGGDYYATAINAVGTKFAKDIFGALSEGNINRSDAGALLGVREHLVERFKDHLFNPGQAS